MHHHKWRFIISALIIPVALYVVFVVSPYGQAVWIAMTDWGGYSASWNFVGLDNFVRVFRDTDFLRALGHNVILLIVCPALIILLGLFLATMITFGGSGQRGSRAVTGVRGAGFYRIVYFFPSVLSIAVIAVMWQAVFEPRNGLLNGFLTAVGLDGLRQVWLGDPRTSLASVIAVMVWVSAGFYVVLFTAAMASIPTEIIEAALIDGANRWATFWRIVLPLVWSPVQTAIIFLIIGALDAFAVVQILTNGGPDNSSTVMALYMYETAFKSSNFGYASAIGVTLLVITLVLTTVTLRITRREI